jgi:predicted P-loop ATPase
MTYAKETKKDVAATTPEDNQLFDKKMNSLPNSNTKCPEHIDQKHWNEWSNSAVRYAIISKNVRSIHDAQEVDKLLNRNNKSRWKHSTNLTPCWAVSGLDPQTGEPTLLGVQVKPDTPILNKSGKLQKYLGASDYDAAPLFLDTGIEGFWQDIITNKNEPIIITEGAKKAGAALSIGYTTISIPGVSTCKKNGRLHELLKLFAGFGRTFYLCFDNDITEKKPVQNAMKSLAKELEATGSKVMVIELPSGDAKGMDDFISQHGAEEFKRIFENSLTIEEWKQKLEEAWLKQQLDDDDQPKCKLKRQFEIIRDGWGDGLRLNKMKNCIELAGQPLDLDQIRLHMVLEFGEAVPIGDAQAIVTMLSGQNAYHPASDYLENVAQRYPEVDTSILDSIATRYFGSDDEMHNIYMRKTLLAAVARIKQPGCKHDSVAVLASREQGIGKSTFWRHLFGDDWFSDELGDANEKDELMKLHNFWCLEWAEFETVYKRKDISALKKFITSKTDTFRTPYSRTVKEYPRMSILVGTTNETEILNDPTGSRRFWVIPVFKNIPTQELLTERDRIWAAAYAAYQSGENWWLTAEQEARREELNKDFQTHHPWEKQIQEFVEFKEEVTTDDIFTCLDIEVANRTTGQSRDISAIMTKSGWESQRRYIRGAWVRTWTKKNKKFGKVSGSSGSSGSISKLCTDDEVFQDTFNQTNNFSECENSPESSKNSNSSGSPSVLYQPEVSATIDPDDPDTFPNFQFFSEQESLPSKLEENQVYWYPKKMKRAKVIKLLKTKPECDVVVHGDTEVVRINTSDLTELPKTDLVKGEAVEVIAGKHKGFKGIVSVVDRATGIWLEKPGKGFKVPIGTFEAFQLKRV